MKIIKQHSKVIYTKLNGAIWMVLLHLASSLDFSPHNFFQTSNSWLIAQMKSETNIKLRNQFLIRMVEFACRILIISMMIVLLNNIGFKFIVKLIIKNVNSKELWKIGWRIKKNWFSKIFLSANGAGQVLSFLLFSFVLSHTHLVLPYNPEFNYKIIKGLHDGWQRRLCFLYKI